MCECQHHIYQYWLISYWKFGVGLLQILVNSHAKTQKLSNFTKLTSENPTCANIMGWFSML